LAGFFLRAVYFFCGRFYFFRVFFSVRVQNGFLTTDRSNQSESSKAARMSKRPQRDAARTSTARNQKLAESSDMSEYSNDEDAAASAALRACAKGRVAASGCVGGAACGGGQQSRVDSDEDYQGDSDGHGEDSDKLEDEMDEDFAYFFDDSSDEDDDLGDMEDDEDDDMSLRPGHITDAEKKTIANIKDKLMFTSQHTFIKDITKGLSAFIICKQRIPLTMAAKVDILSRVSFHQELLTEASRKLICEQTVRAMQEIDLTEIKQASHKIFYELANYSRTRIVAAMISDIDTVLAGILILQLSLAQVAAGGMMGESFAPSALEEQTTLLDHLMSLGPNEGVAQICNMVIGNMQHVQRKKIKLHLVSIRPPQLFDKNPIVRGMGTRAEKVGLFVVRVLVGFEGNMHAHGGNPAVNEHYGEKYSDSGIVSVLPAKKIDRRYGDHVTFPYKKTM